MKLAILYTSWTIATDLTIVSRRFPRIIYRILYSHHFWFLHLLFFRYWWSIWLFVFFFGWTSNLLCHKHRLFFRFRFWLLLNLRLSLWINLLIMRNLMKINPPTLEFKCRIMHSFFWKNHPFELWPFCRILLVVEEVLLALSNEG